MSASAAIADPLLRRAFMNNAGEFIGLAAFIALFRYKVPIIPVVGACAVARLVLILSNHI